MPVDVTVAPPKPTEVETEAGPGSAGADAGRLADELTLEHLPDIDPSVVKGLLRSMGGGLGYVIGDPDVTNHWRFTETELDDITPPLTRMINRRPRWKQAVMRGDEATVAIALASYAGRNVQAGRQANEQREARDGRQPREAERAAGSPGTGAPQPPGGPWGGRRDGGGVPGAPG